MKTLSDKIQNPIPNKPEFAIPNNWLFQEDVKQFIKDLKEEILKDIPRNWAPTLRILGRIDKLAGEKLT